ncbi:type II toxin-antitoxin system RelE/ParE family toxin [Lentisphaerota bacterium WC36G]|nr:type II toxin-antitoxin system RelE/ParE family toxin [Lentisphaerae bacterium WC36]
MIKSFKHKGLKNFFEHGKIKGIQAKHSKKLKIILSYLDAAEEIEDLRIPALKLHLLEPKHESIYAVTVSGNWRITFKFINNNVYIVNYLDYH